MKKISRFAIVTLVLLTGVVIAANYPAHIRIGADGQYRDIRMPLYVKWTQFIARHYEYERLSKEITAGCRTDEEKALAILKWTRGNLKDVPPGMPVCDDHILYTIIRGYGVPEQFQDVFTALCAYAGLPAFWERPYDKGHRARYAISFVKISGKWRVFDAYYGKYFRKDDGEIAAIDDILRDPDLVNGKDIDQITISGVPYKDFYSSISLDQIDRGITLRPYRQMPIRRIVYETRKVLGLEKEPGQ